MAEGKREQVKREIAIFAWFALFIASILLFGFTIAGPAVLALYLKISWRENWLTVIISAALLWAILHFIFDTWIGLTVFQGFLLV